MRIAAAGTLKQGRPLLVALVCLSILPFFHLSKAVAGSLTVSEPAGKGVVTGPAESPDLITGGQGDFLLTEGFYSSTLVPSPRKPIFSFAETDVQLGYMLPIIGNSFYRGNFEGLADLFVWPSVRGPSGVLGGGALGLHYNFIQPGWRIVPYLGARLGISGNNIYTDQQQKIIGGPFEFVLQANVGARFFLTRHCGLILEGGYEHVSNNDIYTRNLGLNQTGGRLGLFWLF